MATLEPTSSLMTNLQPTMTYPSVTTSQQTLTSTTTPTSTLRPPSGQKPTTSSIFTNPSTLTKPPAPRLIENVENVIQVYRFIPRDCCESMNAATIVILLFALIMITIIVSWLLCVALFRKRKNFYGSKRMQKFNDNNCRRGRLSKQIAVDPVVMTPEFKREQFLKNMQNKPSPITTDKKCIGGVLNYLAQNSVENRVMYCPGRQDVVLEPMDLQLKTGTKRQAMHSLSESKIASIPKTCQSKYRGHEVEFNNENEPVLVGGRNLNHTKSAPQKIKKKTMNILK